MPTKIPVCVPVIPKKAKEYTAAVIEKNWVSSLCLDEEVNFIKKLEESFSSYIGVKHGITTTSGTTALDLAVATLKLGPGDEVIVPTFTMVASVTPIIRAGATPVFVDADPVTWCIDMGVVEKYITEKTKAIMPVHIYGYPTDMDKVMEIAKKHNLYVIEDAAEAIGTEYRGRKIGSFGDIACFSFYANKTMTCGEGGIVVTNNDHLAERARMLKDQAFGEPRFIHADIGFNFRMNNLTAAYAYAGFEELQDYVAGRIKNAETYNQFLQGIEGITLPKASSEGIKNSYWMYGILVDEKQYGRSKQETRDLLKQEYGIDTRDFFYPMHKQPIMVEKGYASESTSMPVSEKLWDQGFYLPSSTNLTKEQIQYIADALRKLKKNLNNKKSMLKIGVIGVGSFGQKRAKAVQEAKSAELVAVADADIQKAKEVASSLGVQGYTPEELLEQKEIDAVIIAAPNKFHMPLTVAALRAGKHVHVEKPFARTTEEATMMLASAKAAGKFLKTGSNHRYFSSVQKALEVVKSGAIGDIISFNGRIGNDGERLQNTWFWDKDIAGGGTLLDNGCHLLDIARVFMGDFVEGAGIATNLYWKNCQVEDTATGVFITADGRMATINSSWRQLSGYFHFEVNGTQGYITVDGRFDTHGQDSVYWRSAKDGGEIHSLNFGQIKPNSYLWELEDFFSAIEKGEQPKPSGEDGLAVVKMIEAVYKSNGQRVRI